MRVKSLIPFLAMTFGLAWSSIGLLILFPDQIESAFGELSASNPFFMLAVYSPAIAAFVIVTRHAGWSGLVRYLSRLLLWRIHWSWYLFLILGIPMLFFAGAAW